MSDTMLTALMKIGADDDARQGVLVAYHASQHWRDTIGAQIDAPLPTWHGFAAFPGGDQKWPVRFAVTNDLGDHSWLLFTEDPAADHTGEQEYFLPVDDDNVMFEPDASRHVPGTFTLLTWCRGCWHHYSDDADQAEEPTPVNALFEAPVTSATDIKRIVEASEFCRSNDHTGRKLPDKRRWPNPLA